MFILRRGKMKEDDKSPGEIFHESLQESSNFTLVFSIFSICIIVGILLLIVKYPLTAMLVLISFYIGRNTTK